MAFRDDWNRMGWHIEMEFRLRCRSLLGLALRADEFQGGAEVLGERGVHFTLQATNPARTSAGGGNNFFRPFFRLVPRLVFRDFGNMDADIQHETSLAECEGEDSRPVVCCGS